MRLIYLIEAKRTRPKAAKSKNDDLQLRAKNNLKKLTEYFFKYRNSTQFPADIQSINQMYSNVRKIYLQLDQWINYEHEWNKSMSYFERTDVSKIQEKKAYFDNLRKSFFENIVESIRNIISIKFQQMNSMLPKNLYHIILYSIFYVIYSIGSQESVQYAIKMRNLFRF